MDSATATGVTAPVRCLPLWKWPPDRYSSVTIPAAGGVLGFMNNVIAGHPNQEIHVTLDNLNTHKPKRDRRLARHPMVRFHFIPTYSSWLNMVEA